MWRERGNEQEPGASLGVLGGPGPRCRGRSVWEPLRSLDHPSWSLEAVDHVQDMVQSRAWPWPPGVLCLQTVRLLRAEALSLPVPGYICPEGPCRWPPASPHSPLQVSRPRSPSSPTLERGQGQGSRGQEPAVPSGAAAPPLSRGMTGLAPRRGGRCDEEAGAERAGVPPWFLWICLIPRYSQPFTVAEGRGGEGRRKGVSAASLPPSSLPPPREAT